MFQLSLNIFTQSRCGIMSKSRFLRNNGVGNNRTFSLPGTTLADPDTEELVNPFGKKRRKKKKKMETNLLKEILDFKPAKRFSHWNKLDDALIWFNHPRSYEQFASLYLKTREYKYYLT